MTDEDLKHYLPSYGDRLAVFAFCRRRDNNSFNTRKTKLYERLKDKLSKRKSCDGGSSSHQGQPSQKRNAIKTIRKLEMGWMHYDNKKKRFSSKWEPKEEGVREKSPCQRMLRKGTLSKKQLTSSFQMGEIIRNNNYPDFSSEMNKVFASNVWVMDII